MTKQLDGLPFVEAETVQEIDSEDYAQQWGVSSKVIENWVDVVFQAFDVRLPKKGVFSAVAIALLDEVAKHVSQAASQYFYETGEARRLKYTEFVAKARENRPYRQRVMQQLQRPHEESSGTAGSSESSGSSGTAGSSIVPVGAAAEDEIFGALAEISRDTTEEIDRAKQRLRNWEEQQAEEFVEFLEDSPNRQMSLVAQKLADRRRKRQDASLERATNTAFQGGEP